MLTQHKQTQLVESHQTNKNRNSTFYFYSKTVYPARSAITVTFMAVVKSEYRNL